MIEIQCDTCGKELELSPYYAGKGTFSMNIPEEWMAELDEDDYIKSCVCSEACQKKDVHYRMLC